MKLAREGHEAVSVTSEPGPGGTARPAPAPAPTPGAPSPDPGHGQVVELDVLDDLIQQPVRHGVEVCKCVRLRGTEAPGSGRGQSAAGPTLGLQVGTPQC